MSEWQQHINPWAEKLSQVSLPDGGEGDAWKAMELLLDREMPPGRRGDRRRWVLLILLLLLLIGVCNCPGTKSLFSGKSKLEQTRTFQPAPVDGKGHGGPSAGAVEAPGAEARGGAETPGTEVKRQAGIPGAAKVGTPKVERFDPVTDVRKAKREKLRTRKATTADRETGATGDLTGATAGGTPGKRPDTTTGSPPGKNTGLSSKKTPPSSKNGGNKVDSGNKRNAANKVDSSKKERYGGWMVGIGLNQFFTVGGQQASSFNSGGITGTLGDYIPVPMVRYYFNPRLYVQLEAQINTPQYTRKNLVAVSTPVDSIGTTTGGTLITVQKSVAINKLFYFNVPLSLHYAVFDHLDLGAGLQYSRLTNGIGVFNQNYSTGGADSLATATKSFKGDSVYKKIKTQEFRFLVDANYNWKHFIVGIRYNQALSRFIHIEISPGQLTQARNSSLQLYLRYILWDGRKKKPLLPSK